VTNKELPPLVVSQFPKQEVRTALLNDVEYELITIEDAITEILINTRAVKKSVA
jgi:hypothetical protein